MNQDKPIRMTGKEYYEALQQARREALEEACQAVCEYCRQGVKVRKTKGYTWENHDKEVEYFTHNFSRTDIMACKASEIRKLMKMVAAAQGQGQTTQAEPVEGNEGIASSQD